MSDARDRPRPGDVLVMVGTRKGSFLFWSDPARRSWRHAQQHAQLSVNALSYDSSSGAIYAATNGTFFNNGAAIQRSVDRGVIWTALSNSMAFDDDRRVWQIWQVMPGHPTRPGEVWAGTREAGLFRSGDGGQTWQSVRGLNDHPTHTAWHEGGAGIILHTIVIDPYTPARMYACVSAGGVYRSDDGGATWQPINRGVRADFLSDPCPVAGHCPHKLVLHRARPGVLFQQNHCGVYRSDDYGDTWVDISDGLSSRFGFPIAVHPHDPNTIYVVPLVSDKHRVVPDGQMAVWRSRSSGAGWECLTQGLPAQNAWLTILRESLTVDTCDPAGVYVGTTSGQLFYSRDEGEHWELLADYLPAVVAVRAVLVTE
jgi:photosystem II stability/assembly factor-like uncharacterized protein